jgi:DNA mismatch repair protein MutS2
MNSHTLKVLEYEKIINYLVSLCRSVPGKHRADKLLPGTDSGSINHNLDLTAEVVDMFEFDGGPPDLEFGDLGLRLAEAASSGSVIEPRELLEYSAFFKTIFNCQKIKPKYEKITALLSGLIYPETAHRAIDRSIDDSGEIKDSASAELKSIRIELRQSGPGWTRDSRSIFGTTPPPIYRTICIPFEKAATSCRFAREKRGTFRE